MHREIQIKQFPIVTTHWWPKTRNERLCEKTNSIYIVFYLLYTTMSKWSECAHASGVWRCVRALWLTLHSHRASASTLDGGRVWSVVLTRRHSYTTITYFSGVAWTDWVLHEAIWLADASVGAWKVASAPRFRHASVKRWRRRPCECSVSQSARTHRHTPDACAHSDHLDMVVYKR